MNLGTDMLTASSLQAQQRHELGGVYEALRRECCSHLRAGRQHSEHSGLHHWAANVGYKSRHDRPYGRHVGSGHQRRPSDICHGIRNRALDIPSIPGAYPRPAKSGHQRAIRQSTALGYLPRDDGKVRRRKGGLINAFQSLYLISALTLFNRSAAIWVGRRAHPWRRWSRHCNWPASRRCWSSG